MNETYLRVLGSANWLPTVNNDCSCYTIGDRILVDTGTCAGKTLIDQGIDPTDIPLICFTHMHADHSMGLPQLLLAWRIRYSSLAGLTIAGPAEKIRFQYNRAFEYVFSDSDDVTSYVKEQPTILELHGGDSFDTEDYHIEVMNGFHAVPELCYRFTHKKTGKVLCMTGDTRFFPELPDFFHDCDLLVHEVSFGAGPIPEEQNRVCRHSSAHEAVKVARECRAKKLLLTHAPLPNRAPALAYATEQLSIPVEWAMPLHVFEF